MSNKDLEQSIKAKVRQIAEQSGKIFNEVWQTLVLERLLVRLSHSPYKGNLVFKGGLLLSQYLQLGRETADLDFLARKMRNEAEHLKDVFTEIGAIDLEDGFTFGEVRSEVLGHAHMGYEGIRISIVARLEKTETPVQVDVGFGDVVSPESRTIKLLATRKGPVFEGEVSIQAYPPEAIFAEKLETTVYRGGANSRMKDFHDMWRMCGEPRLLDPGATEAAIQSTFENRGTEIALPINYEGDDIETLQDLWNAHLRDLGRNPESSMLPEKFMDLIDKINDWLRTNTSLTPNPSRQR
jgi:predicted nucleotidyltransferase component of viral defense system